MNTCFNMKDMKKIYKYISDMTDLLSIAINLKMIEEVHGADKVRNLINFIDCWERYQKEIDPNEDITRVIVGTLVHDLTANCKATVLRSASYTKKYCDDFLKNMHAIKNENIMVTKTPIDDLPLLIESLKFESSKKILEDRMKEENTRQ